MAIQRYMFTDGPPLKTPISVKRKAREIQLGYVLTFCLELCTGNLIPSSASGWLVHADGLGLDEFCAAKMPHLPEWPGPVRDEAVGMTRTLPYEMLLEVTANVLKSSQVLLSGINGASAKQGP